jgi:hypothetical protein
MLSDHWRTVWTRAGGCQLAVKFRAGAHVSRQGADDATTIVRYVDRQGRPDRQVDVCDVHTNALCAGLKVIDRRRFA